MLYRSKHLNCSFFKWLFFFKHFTICEKEVPNSHFYNIYTKQKNPSTLINCIVLQSKFLYIIIRFPKLTHTLYPLCTHQLIDRYARLSCSSGGTQCENHLGGAKWSHLLSNNDLATVTWGGTRMKVGNEW